MRQVRARGMHHLALGAKDVEGLALFYERALGLVRNRTHFDESGQLRAIWLQLDSRGPQHGLLMVEKSHDYNQIEHHPGVGSGWFLSAFVVEPVERKAAEQQIEAAGAAIESRSEFSSYARDPEGNRFAISCYPLA